MAEILPLAPGRDTPRDDTSRHLLERSTRHIASIEAGPFDTSISSGCLPSYEAVHIIGLCAVRQNNAFYP